MIQLGAIANIEEKAARLRHADRPINIHMVKCLTVLGIKMKVEEQTFKAENPHLAGLVAEMWADEVPKKGESITVWMD